jgi:flagellar biosynthesis anti-sigma factor FlgM
MRIDLSSGGAVSGSQIDKTASPQRTQTASASIGNESGISESDMSAGKLTAAALNSPEVRTEMVQALKSQIESGSYQVSPAQVAGSMIEQMRVRAS